MLRFLHRDTERDADDALLAPPLVQRRRQVFEADPQTKAIAIYTEPGGRMEAELSDWVAENDSRLPVVAFRIDPACSVPEAWTNWLYWHGALEEEAAEPRERWLQRLGPPPGGSSLEPPVE